MKESFGEIKNSELVPESLNNFWMWLPGGFKHEKYRGMDGKCDSIIDKVDELLKEEFPDVNAAELIKDINEYRQGKTPELEKKYIEVNKKLKLLFDRLVESGFEPWDLKR